MKLLFAGCLCLAATAAPALKSSPDHADLRCRALTARGGSALQILSAAKAPAGIYRAPNGDTLEVPASCRIVAVVRATADSEIGFELWLPDGWNGRYSQLGNGGFAGNIDQPSLANEIRRGNAAAMTDTGHKANQFDASWALGHPEKVIDYGYRSIKVTSDAAEVLIAKYYGRSARGRYFIGCSNGGRQALMAAQRYPNDWDGIIAGSPPVYWTKQLATFAAIQHRLRASPDNWIPANKLPAIERAAINACGSRLLCRVNVTQLRCVAPADGRNCLTPAQAATLELIQSGPKDASGRPAFFGFDPRAAALPDNWPAWILNPDRNAPSDLAFATQAYRYLILDRAAWQVEDFDFARDFPRASGRKVSGYPLSAVLDADNPDLSHFARRGGKMLMYVGWSDALISPAPAVAYYHRAMERMGGLAKTQRFFRLFIVPGMQHCQGGAAPNAFGQAWVAPPLKPDEHHDIRVALEAWVEHGRAPASLTAVKFDGDSVARGPPATQRLLPYPAVAWALTEAH